MKKRSKFIGMIILLLMISTILAVTNHNAAANKPPANHKKSAEQIMAKYSTKDTQNLAPNFRRSRLKEMNVVTEAANVLNVLPIDIMNGMQKGKTLVQIAKGKGLSKAQFLQKLTDYENNLIKDAVSKGTITEEHEKALKEGQKDRLTKSLSLKAVNVNEHQGMDMGN